MEQDFILIEKYLRKELNEVEFLKFKERMDQDIDFAKEVKFHQDLTDFLAFKDVLGQVEKQKEEEGFFREVILAENQNKKTKSAEIDAQPRLFSNKVLFIAASILIILTLCSLFYANKNYSDANLFAVNLTDFDTSQATKGNIVKEDVFKVGFDLLDEKNYEKAIGFFNGFDENHKIYLQAQFFLGIAQQGAGKTKASVETLESLLKTNPSTKRIRIISLKQKAEWILAKFLLENEDERGKILLVKIKNNENHQFKDEAEYLFEQLNSRWRYFVF